MSKMDDILNEPFKRGICPKCGQCQTHSLRWCHCGGEFFKNSNWTCLDALRFAHNRQMQNIRLSGLRPDYIAAIYRRELEPFGINDQEFTQYIIKKLEESHG